MTDPAPLDSADYLIAWLYQYTVSYTHLPIFVTCL